MSPEALEQYLHEHIPLSKAMGVEVVAAERSVTLRAPLAPNINHRDTVFGGSASALAILAAWSLLHTRLAAAGVSSRLVIQRNTMEYVRPIAGEFVAEASLPEGDRWDRFVRTLGRRGRARIRVEAVVRGDEGPAGKLTGEFVAMAPKPEGQPPSGARSLPDPSDLEPVPSGKV